MADEKKIVFSGQDNGASQTASKIYNTILSNAKKYTETLKEQTTYINAQIKALEKKAKLESSQANKNLNETNELWLHANPRDKDRYSGRAQEIRKGLDDSKAVLDMLKNIYQEERRHTSAAEKAEKINNSQSLSSEQRHQAMKSLARQEVRENKEGVRKKIISAEKSDYADLDPQSAEKLMYQKSLIGGKQEGSKGDNNVFAAIVGANIIQQIANALQTAGGAKTGEQGLNSLVSAIPYVGGLASTVLERNREEQQNTGLSQYKLQAVTGSKFTGSDIPDHSDFGYSKRADFSILGNLIAASGTTKGYGKNLEQARVLDRGLGLSTETITQIVKDIRTTRSSADITQIASDVLRANPELRKEQTKFTEILSQTSQLTNQLASQGENVNIRDSAGIVGSLRSIGGSFADPILGPQRMMSINSSLTNPGSEFQKARSFGVLSKLNPGASYFQLLEAQEKGIGQKGYLSGILKQFSKEGGNEENTALQVMTNLGIPASTARKLVQEYRKNPKKFDSFTGGKNDIDRILGLTDRAKENTSNGDKSEARTDNAYLISSLNGLGQAVKETAKALTNAGTTIVDGIFGKKNMDILNSMFLQISGYTKAVADSTIKIQRGENVKENKLYNE